MLNRLALAALFSSAALPTARAAELDVYQTQRPIKLGARVGVWSGDYSSPAIGGHIKIAASERVGLQGFADHASRKLGGVVRHDNVVGFNAHTPVLIGSQSWFLSPTLGACVDFRVDEPLSERLPSNADILFGVNAGAMGEFALGRGWSLESTATGYLYVGNGSGTSGWTAGASNKLQTSAVVQVLGSLNYQL